MKSLYLILFLAFFQNSFAQFARIMDPDGFSNLRENAASNSTILRKIPHHEVVYVLDDDLQTQHWKQVVYTKSNHEELYGFVYHSRLQNISKLTPIHLSRSSDGVMYFNDSLLKIEVEVARTPFDAQKEISFFTKKDGYYQFYRNKEMWGVDGNLPHFRYQFIRVKINGKTIEVPSEVLENLFEPTIISQRSEEKYVSVYVDATENLLYLMSTNSQGAGAYEVVFIFQDQKFSKAIAVLPF